MKRFLSLFLAALFLTLSAPMPSGAVAAADNTDVPAAPEVSATRVEELVGLRETNSEIYLLSDGTFEYVAYSEDKYYRDEENTLQPIDNTLIPVSASRDDSPYRNAANSFDVRLSSTGTPTVGLTYEDHGVTFSPVSDSRTASPMSVGPVTGCSTLSMLTSTGKNTARYDNVFGGADLVYVLTNSSLKEYIILEDSAAPSTYSFTVTLDNLTMEQTGNSILLKDERNEPVFSLGGLFAVDAAGEMTENVTYTVSPGASKGTFVMTVTLDSAYLQDPDRQFPVVVDPTVTTLFYSSAQTADAYVSSANPNTNYYVQPYLRTGRDSPYGIRRSYIRFELIDVLPVNSIQSAYLDLVFISGDAPTVRAYKCSEEWNSSTITWNNQPGYIGEGSGYAVPRSSGSSWYRMDVMDIVKSFYSSGVRHGFVLKDDVESNVNHWATFYSSDAASPNKPELHINFSAPTVNVQLYYDQAYYARNPLAATTMNTYAEELQRIYKYEFGILLLLGQPTLFTSLADTCPHLQNGLCTCGDCVNSLVNGNNDIQETHHTNAYNIMAHSPRPNGVTTVSVIFTGNKICLAKNGCEGEVLYGLNAPGIGVCIVDGKETDRALKTMVHEFGHFYDADLDHYGENGYDSSEDLGSNYSRDCMYGENRGSVPNDTFCKGCRARIHANSDKYDPSK